MSVDLYDALKSSYGDKKSKEKLANAGYKYDSMLSNHNEQVWYNPNEKKLLYNVAGTHNLSDVGTDLYLAFGKLKDTNRYKEAGNKLEEAKKKYNVDNATITGHSLGGAVSQYIANKNDKVYTLNKGATIGQKTRGNETAIRTSGDAVSLMNAGSTRMKTIDNTGLGFLNYLNPLASHNVSNIKDYKIRI